MSGATTGIIGFAPAVLAVKEIEFPVATSLVTEHVILEKCSPATFCTHFPRPTNSVPLDSAAIEPMLPRSKGNVPMVRAVACIDTEALVRLSPSNPNPKLENGA
jgi:hypothetical protein